MGSKQREHVFYYRDRELFCEDVSLAEIAAAFDTPVYIYSQTELEKRAAAYENTLNDLTQRRKDAKGSNPRLSAIDTSWRAYRVPSPSSLVCYAVKANNNLTILRLVAAAGLGADVTSGGELFLALKAGFPPDKIIYSGVGKTRREINEALEANIHALHVESAMELAVIGEIAAARQQVVAIGIRINPNIVASTHPKISTGQSQHKFGVAPEQAITMFREAAAHPWLQPIGLAAHIGSQITSLEPFVQASHTLVALADELHSLGIALDYLDVGGGLGIAYQQETPPTLTDWATQVAQPVLTAGYDVVIEPGRSLVGSAGALLTQVVYTKSQGEKEFVIVDAGMSDLLRPTLYNAYHPIVSVQEAAAATPKITVDVVGPICETGDYLALERPLPPQQPGNLLAILQAGAYGFAMSSNYNGRPRPAEVLVKNNQFSLIRSRQTYTDL